MWRRRLVAAVLMLSLLPPPPAAARAGRDAVPLPPVEWSRRRSAAGVQARRRCLARAGSPRVGPATRLWLSHDHPRLQQLPRSAALPLGTETLRPASPRQA